MTYEQAREKIADILSFGDADTIFELLLTPTQLEAWKKGGELAVFKRDVSPQSEAEK